MTLVIHFLWLMQHLAGLAKLLQLKIGAKAILTVKIDIQDGLIIGQAGKLLIVTMLKILLETYVISFLIYKLL